jgi:hypothetical protein
MQGGMQPNQAYYPGMSQQYPVILQQQSMSHPMVTNGMMPILHGTPGGGQGYTIMQMQMPIGYLQPQAAARLPPSMAQLVGTATSGPGESGPGAVKSGDAALPVAADPGARIHDVVASASALPAMPPLQVGVPISIPIRQEALYASQQQIMAAAYSQAPVAGSYDISTNQQSHQQPVQDPGITHLRAFSNVASASQPPPIAFTISQDPLAATEKGSSPPRFDKIPTGRNASTSSMGLSLSRE